MKLTSRILIVLIGILFSISDAFSQYQPVGNITITAQDGSPFYLILNGVQYNRTALNSIRVEELNLANYTCEIVFENQRQPKIRPINISMVNKRGVMQDLRYNIVKNHRSYNELQLVSSVPAAQNSFRATTTTFRNNEPNKVVGTDARFPHGPGHYPREQNENEWLSSLTCVRAMDSRSFADAKSAIQNASFDDTRLSIAKQAIESNCMSVNQIIEVLPLFSFESTKLSFAKYAYEYCVDPQNYFKVGNAFSFDSSKSQLLDYIQNNQNGNDRR